MADGSYLHPLGALNFNLPTVDISPLTDVRKFTDAFPLPPDVSRRRYKPIRKIDESIEPNFEGAPIHVKGELRSIGIADDWKGDLDEIILSNLLDRRNSITVLNPLQKWIHSLVTCDVSGTVAASRGSRKTLGFLIPLIQKVHCTVSSTCYAPTAVKKVMPLTLILTATEEKAEHIVRQARWISKGTKIHTRIAYQDQNPLKDGQKADILIGKSDHVMQYIIFNNLSLARLTYIVFVECEANEGANEMSNAAELLYPMVEKDCDTWPDILLVFNHVASIPDALKRFINRKGGDPSLLAQETRTTPQSRVPDFKVISCNSEEYTFVHKCSSLRRVIEHVWCEKRETRDGKRTRRKCVIVVNSTLMANYIATFCTYLYKILFPVVTRDTDSIGVENARLRLRTGETNFVVCDYTGLTFIEPGYTDFVVMFELPRRHIFFQKMDTVMKLSANISCKCVYIFFDPKEDQDSSSLLLKILVSCEQSVPRDLYNSYLEWKKELQDSSPEEPSNVAVEEANSVV